MKIAIQGHPTRGKEVIQILESLGGKNTIGLGGTYNSFYYIDGKNKIIDDYKKYLPSTYKLYTLEEFEEEFPFKVGDEVFHKGHKAIVEMFVPRENCYYIRYNNPPIDGCYYTKWTTATELKMKEERNITLTLNKAKEWYKKGGELKEIALQAFTEKELIKIELPKTWEEFCKNHPIKDGEAFVRAGSVINTLYNLDYYRDDVMDRNVCPSKQSAEAHLILIQLEQLRDCWRQGWIPKTHAPVYTIKFSVNGLNVYYFNSRAFLSFPTYEMAKEFLECFRDLIEKAGDLI